VPGIINMALDTVCTDLEAEGYEVWPIVFPAHALGAWHKRDRLWIIAYRDNNQQKQSECNNQEGGLSSESRESIRFGAGSGTDGRDTAKGSEQSGRNPTVLQAVVADTNSPGDGTSGYKAIGDGETGIKHGNDAQSESGRLSKILATKNVVKDPLSGRLLHGESKKEGNEIRE
jgi:site-specific DNA-cytosine methylase